MGKVFKAEYSINIMATFVNNFALRILNALQTPKRYADLIDICHNERTRTKKLRALENAGLIESVSIKVGNKNCTSYKLTPKGQRALQLLQELESL